MFPTSRLLLLILIVAVGVLVTYSFIGIGSQVKIIPTSQGIAMVFQISSADKQAFEKLAQQLGAEGLFNQPITLSLDAESKFLVKDLLKFNLNIAYSDGIVNFGNQPPQDRLRDIFEPDKTQEKILEFLPEDTVWWAKMASADFLQFLPANWPDKAKDFFEEFLTGDAILAVVPDNNNLGVIAARRDFLDEEPMIEKFHQLSDITTTAPVADSIDGIQVWSQVATNPENSWWLFYSRGFWVLSSSANLARQEVSLAKGNGSSILRNQVFIKVFTGFGKSWKRQIYWRGPTSYVQLPQKINLAAYGTINLGQKDLVFENLINKIASVAILQSDYIIKGQVLIK